MPRARAAASRSKGAGDVPVGRAGSAPQAAPVARRMWQAISDSPGQHFAIVLGVLGVLAVGAAVATTLLVLAGATAAGGGVDASGASLAMGAAALLVGTPAT